MTLTARERQQLADIERRFIADEPRLHRALSWMDDRPLNRRPVRMGRPCGREARGVHGHQLPRVMAILVLGSGLTMLATGAITGLMVVMIVGVAMAQFGPLVAFWLLTQRVGVATISRSESSTPVADRP